MNEQLLPAGRRRNDRSNPGTPLPQDVAWALPQVEKRRQMMEAWTQFLEGSGGSDVIPIKMVRI